MTHKYNRGPSEAQSNAEALARREAAFAPENRTSAGMAYDFRRRQTPRDLRHAVALVRRAYQDEVPTKLHESGLADDGTPAMTAKAEAYIFGSPTWTDAGSSKRCNCAAQRTSRDASPGTPTTSGRSRPIEQAALPVELTPRGGSVHLDDCPANPTNAPLVSYFLTPFRATLDGMERHPAESTRKRAAIVRHVTIGSQDPESAAQSEGVPSWCSRDVAFQALSTFLRMLSDVRVDVRPEAVA